jgi:hypothetical protein
MSTRTPRRLLAATAAAALAAVTVGAASASAGSSGEEMVGIGRVYDNGHYALFTGPPFEQGCMGEFPLFPAHVVTAPGGIRTFTARGTNDAMLYDLTALGLTSGVELIGVACDAVFGGGDVPEPIATGQTQDVLQGRETADAGQYRDSSRGTLYGTDGTRYEVQGGSLEIGGSDTPDNLVEQHLVVKIR